MSSMSSGAPRAISSWSPTTMRMVVRLVAVAVTATIQPYDSKARVGQRLLPSAADPVEAVVRGESMHGDERRAILRPVDLVMQPDSIAVEIHGAGTYASRSS